MCIEKRSTCALWQGVAIAMGFCAASHLDSVLGKLDSVAKNDMVQKSGGLFKFMKVASVSLNSLWWEHVVFPWQVAILVIRTCCVLYEWSFYRGNQTSVLLGVFVFLLSVIMTGAWLLNKNTTESACLKQELLLERLFYLCWLSLIRSKNISHSEDFFPICRQTATFYNIWKVNM